MAVAGGATVAYNCWLAGNKLVQSSTTYPASMCASVEDAMVKLQRGERVTVAGANKHELNLRLNAMGVEVGG